MSKFDKSIFLSAQQWPVERSVDSVHHGIMKLSMLIDIKYDKSNPLLRLIKGHTAFPIQLCQNYGLLKLWSA